MRIEHEPFGVSIDRALYHLVRGIKHGVTNCKPTDIPFYGVDGSVVVDPEGCIASPLITCPGPDAWVGVGRAIQPHVAVLADDVLIGEHPAGDIGLLSDEQAGGHVLERVHQLPLRGIHRMYTLECATRDVRFVVSAGVPDDVHVGRCAVVVLEGVVVATEADTRPRWPLCARLPRCSWLTLLAGDLHRV